MARPQRSNPSSRRILVERDSVSEPESDAEAEEDQEPAGRGVGVEEEPKKKPSITISLKKVCKVCKGTGHQAGFSGATYIDCPKKPCFLCKKPVGFLVSFGGGLLLGCWC